MTESAHSSDIDEYIDRFPEATRKVLAQLRTVIRQAAPAAAEKITYGMPTYCLHDNLVHFAAHKNHIGFYPTPSAVVEFAEELAPYKTSKGAIQFPLGEALPMDLIRRIVLFRVAQNTERIE